jgi:hypothetical protein
LNFENGSVATAEERCGAGDLCATLKLPNGDTISVYNGGAIRCKPYTLKVVRMHGDTKLFDYDAQTDTAHGFFTAGNCSDTFANTYLTIGNGGARLGIFQNTDGSLFARWEGGKGYVGPGGPHPDKCEIPMKVVGMPLVAKFPWDSKQCQTYRENQARKAAEAANASPAPSASPSPSPTPAP